MSELKYKRILLKISGEALLGEQQFGIDQKPVQMIANEIKKARDFGAEIAIVVGGGNIFRGMKNSAIIPIVPRSTIVAAFARPHFSATFSTTGFSEHAITNDAKNKIAISCI